MDRLTYRIPDVARLTSMSVPTIYREIARGRLQARKLAGSTVILANELSRYLSDLPLLKLRSPTK